MDYRERGSHARGGYPTYVVYLAQGNSKSEARGINRHKNNARGINRHKNNARGINRHKNNARVVRNL